MGNDGNGGKTNGERVNWPGRAISEVAYPTLTIPMRVDEGGSEGSWPSGGSGDESNMGRSVDGALREVLGWDPRSKDGRGFVGALNAAFDLKEVEGHTEFTWKERTFAVFTDLEGGVTGAQASVHTRARHAVDQALPLLTALYPLSQDSDKEEIEAIKSLIRQHLHDLVKELGRHGGPRVLRVDQTLELLLGRDESRVEGTIKVARAGELAVDTRLQKVPGGADEIFGEIGRLREELGLSLDEGRANTVEEETNQTNYRILADYVIGLRLAWVDNRRYFSRAAGTSPFFGTQLVHMSRLLSVIAEQVREVRFALNSVFIGPRERQTLELVPQWPEAYPDYYPPTAESVVRLHGDPSTPPTARGVLFKTSMGRTRDDKPVYVFVAAIRPERLKQLLAKPGGINKPFLHGTREMVIRESEPIYLEELLSWIDGFAREEGPNLIKDGGKLGVAHAFLPTAFRLKKLVAGIRAASNAEQLPEGYLLDRVQNPLHELEKHFDALLRACEGIEYESEEGYDDRSDPTPLPPPSASPSGSTGPSTSETSPAAVMASDPGLLTGPPSKPPRGSTTRP